MTQADADLTKPRQLYGPYSDMPSLAELGSAIEGARTTVEIGRPAWRAC